MGSRRRDSTRVDRACRPIALHRSESGTSLVGRVNEQTLRQGRTVSRSFEVVVVDRRIGVTCGGNTEHFRREPDGTLVPTTSDGYGCMRRVGLELSRVTPDAVWFNGSAVRLTVACTHVVEESTSCRAGGSRSCDGCAAWGLLPASGAPNVGFGTAARRTPVVVNEPADCAAPCARVEMPANAQRAHRALEGRTFMRAGPHEHPFFFRTERACLQYRRDHPTSAAETEAW